MPLQTYSQYQVPTGPSLGAGLASKLSSLLGQRRRQQNAVDLMNLRDQINQKNLKRVADQKLQRDMVHARGLQLQHARDMDDPAKQRMMVSLMIENATKAGGNPQELIRLLDIEDPDDFNLALTQQSIRDLTLGGGSARQPDPIKKQKGGTVLMKDEDDNYFFATQSFDPITGAGEFLSTPAGHNNPQVGGLTPVSRMGETPEDKIQNTLRTHSGKAQIDIDAEGEKTRVRESEKSEAQRIATAIDEGMAAASAIPEVIRALEILETVETGGFAGLSMRAKRKFGLESAEEAELQYTLLKNVLKQLRPTFGSQFTEREGALLREIEASTDKSTEGNRRLLETLLQKLQLTAKQGKNAAKRDKQPETVNLIQDKMDARITIDDSSEGDLSPEEQAELEALEREFGNQ